MKSVEEVKPNIIALGYDQLKDLDFYREIKIRGLDTRIVRMHNKFSTYSSSDIKNRICTEWCR